MIDYSDITYTSSHDKDTFSKQLKIRKKQVGADVWILLLSAYSSDWSGFFVPQG